VSGEGEVHIKLRKYSSHDKAPPVISKQKLKTDVIPRSKYKKMIIILALVNILTFFGGFLIAKTNIFPEGIFDNGYNAKMYLRYDLGIIVQSSPLDIVINVSRAESSSAIIYAAYQVANVTNYTLFELNTKTNTMITIPHEIYYELLNNKNNTVQIKLRNAENMTVIKSATFEL
jgi:hypothetical protein